MSDINETMIKIGTCIPGNSAEQWLAPMADVGFETASINFHMKYSGVDVAKQGPVLRELAESKGIQITTLGYYCNPLISEEHRKNLEYAIDHAALYGAERVATFAGGVEGKSVPESMERFGEVFGELCRRAEDKGLKLVIENCPMGGTWRHVTCNIGFCPKAWEMMFDAVPSDVLGLEWEPAHQMTQLIDPLPQLRKWVKKVYHLHGKDATVDWQAVRENGYYVENFVENRTPGFGDTNWRDVFYILMRNGYRGDICVEGYHDPIYSGALEMTGQIHALHYLQWCRGGKTYTPNPWDK